MAGDGPDDFDAWMRDLLDEALDQALAKLTPEQVAKLGEDDALSEKVSTAIGEAIDNSADLIVDTLTQNSPPMLAERQAFRVKFEGRVVQYWGRAFDLSEMVIRVAHELGEAHYEKHVPPDGVRDYAFEVLARLQARALRIAEEVLVLLKAGYGQAAMARWRALHEVAVVADFILEHGDDCAERYFAHEAVETWKAMREFQTHATALGETPYKNEQEQATKTERDAVIAKYGKRFGEDYGWAQAALAAKNPQYVKDRVTVKAIEKSVGADLLRPHYRIASHGVHANPKGVTWMPDSLPSERGLVLLTGPSPMGLADPGHATLISLTTVTDAVLASKPGEAARLSSRILQGLTDEAGDAYLKAHQRLERDGRADSNSGGPETVIRLVRSLRARIDVVPFAKRSKG
ncbi:MAG: DUF5677 domain-containing protein [Solirubrobacteraceae bacterium]